MCLPGCPRFLDISFNRLKGLPGSLSSLGDLAALNLAYNPLGAFPEVLCTLTSLRELNLDQTGAAFQLCCNDACTAVVPAHHTTQALPADECDQRAPYTVDSRLATVHASPELLNVESPMAGR